MTLKSTAVKTGIAALALTAMGLAAAAPASAHTNNMYTYYVYDVATDQAGFATYGKTDGVLSLLPSTTAFEETYIAGIEVAGEQGVMLWWDFSDFYVTTWNHTTGERGADVAAYFTIDVPVELGNVIGLDTLNDGRTITVVEYFTAGEGDGDIVRHFAIASVNVGTGELVELMSLDQLGFEGEYFVVPTSLATDPATGITYVFLQNDISEVGWVAVDVATGEFLDIPTQLEAPYFAAGEVLGVDFDQATGELYFNYANYNNEQVELLKLTTGPDTWASAAPVFISLAPAQYDDFELAHLALTIEYTALAATGSELPALAIVLVGTVAVLAGGVTVAVARRRSEAGTV